MGHALMENRNGLAVAAKVTHDNGTAERRAAENLLAAQRKVTGRRITASANKSYDTSHHVTNLRDLEVTPLIAQNNAPTRTGRQRRSSIDRRTTRHDGCGKSQTRRKMIECIFGWGK
jgi:hypothetical protein